jgi:hypothetical protein
MPDKYQLKPGVTIFYDDQSDLKVVAGQTVELDEETVTPKTAQALMSGALVKVKAPKKEAPSSSKDSK